jgi:hypothetical protein
MILWHSPAVNAEHSGATGEKIIDLPAALISDIKAPSFFDLRVV